MSFQDNRAMGGNGQLGSVSGGDTGDYGRYGGSGGGFNSNSNSTLGGSGGNGAGEYIKDGRPGKPGSDGGFGAGGGGGGGGGGAFSGWLLDDPEDVAGNGGAGGAGGFGAGGGGGGGGGHDYDFYTRNEDGTGGAGGTGGQFGGDGSPGHSGGSERLGGTGGGGAGLGGAIFVNSGANLTLLNSVFTGNSVAGGTGANNGKGLGANIFVKDGGTAQAIGTNYSDTYGTINTVSFPDGYEYDNEYDRSIYRLTTAGTWQQAQLQAESLGGNLVTINNEKEQNWLVTTFGGTENLWTGLTDKVTQSEYKWASGETSTYTNWYPGQPDNAGNKDYVGMNFGGAGRRILDAGKWSYLPNTASIRGIVENKLFEYNGSKYLLTGPGTWEQAQAQAQSLGGNLVTINNENEQKWLVTKFGDTENLWIGFTDQVKQGEYKWASEWASDKTSTYTNWYPGQPDNAGNKDYVGMNFGGAGRRILDAGKWSYLPNTASIRGIVENKLFEYNGSKYL